MSKEIESRSTAYIICKCVANIFDLTGLSLIGSGSVICINGMTSSVISLLAKVLKKYDMSQVNKKEDNSDNISFDDCFNYIKKISRSCFNVAFIIGLGIAIKRAGIFMGKEETINFLNSEKK